jgi:hypothetical protein
MVNFQQAKVENLAEYLAQGLEMLLQTYPKGKERLEWIKLICQKD